ncbi:MAG: hypothetical protein GWN30_20640 [Gammaproteobacteria bacterium]|nr:hypothetical protein [Gammaproteobacteria bacterium]NIX00626.1 hypothetical protein [Phycisphaerae bacterium]
MATISSLTTSGAVTGSDTLTVPSNILGGYKLNGDGTNEATLVIRDQDASGDILISTATISGEESIKPMLCSGTIHYTVGGTGGDAMIFGWERNQSY